MLYTVYTKIFQRTTSQYLWYIYTYKYTYIYIYKQYIVFSTMTIIPVFFL